MRIISGRYRGKRIQAPKALPVRPTTDMAKEALFNILTNNYYLEELRILDLFAGTGNISFEFASRGVTFLRAVDRNPKCASFIAKTARELDFQIDVVKSDALKYLSRSRDQFDLIFADPPYDFSTADLGQIAELVFQRELLASEGLLILEHSKFNDLSGLPNYKESRKYGGSVFSFFGY